MRRSSSRKAAQQVAGSMAVNSSAGNSDLLHSASSNDASKETEQIDHLFYAYSEESSDVIGRQGMTDRRGFVYHRREATGDSPEGIEAFCTDMGIKHTDVRILMLAWRMKAEKQGYFTLEEWRRGLKALPVRADTINKLNKALPELEKEISRPQNFQDFYSYSFRYCLAEDKQKCIDIDTASELLKIVLGFKFLLQVDRLGEYLKKQHEYKVVTMDQWMGILRFCNEINFPSLDNYDPGLAWPLILDNFVEWMREQ